MKNSEINSAETQYLNIGRNIVENGTWVENKRTGKRCLTVFNATMDVDCANNSLPLITTRKSHARIAIAEFLGHLRGYSSAEQYRSLNCNVWNANANENNQWLNNPFRKGADDLGRVYGVQIRDWRNPENKPIDQLANVVDKLKNGVDDRRLIITLYNVGEQDRGCLAPCMHTHQFCLLGDTLHLSSEQRSSDYCLGKNFNIVQQAWFLMVMAQITGHKVGRISHRSVNEHIYDDQLDLFKNVQLPREPFKAPTLEINPILNH